MTENEKQFRREYKRRNGSTKNATKAYNKHIERQRSKMLRNANRAYEIAMKAKIS
jgi:hypothetical protein